MSMKFETNDRPDMGVQQKLTENNTPLSKIPFPKNFEEPYVNFQEVLASERYKDVVENFHKYNGENSRIGNNMLSIQPIMMQMMMAHNEILNLENGHYEELEKLAIDLIMKEMGIPEGSFNFDVKIVGNEQIEGDFNHGDQENNKNEVDIDEEDIPLNNDEDLEISKRRLINAIIQGSSKRGHYMYHIVEDKVNEIIGDEKIIKLYGQMMSINDTMYWQLSDEVIKMMGGGDGGEASVAGKEKIDRNTTPPTIYARAVNFPVLIHEIIKGIMELFAVHGLPENYDNFASEEETIENESWDLRLGPSIWKKLRSQFPIEIIIDEDKVELQNYLLVEIFKMDARDFLYFMREIMKESDEGKKIMNDLLHKILREINDNEEDTDE